jgi:hypothetical protein
MRLLSVLGLLAVFLVCSSGRAGPKNATEQPDISRSGREFLEVCSGVDGERNGNPVRVYNDATCLGWVEGFADGFTVHDELLGVLPVKDRMACVPHEVTTIRTVRILKKYIAGNPDKAHRPTRYVASLAMVGAFPCKAGK